MTLAEIRFGRTHDPRLMWGLLLLLCMGAAGIFSVYQGTDNSFDLRNYHFYNPWEILNHRFDLDVAPAQKQSYFNPTLDFFFYGLVHYLNDWPRLIAFTMGALHGINAFLLVLIARTLFAPAKVYDRRLFWLLVIIAVAIGVSGADAVSLTGMTTGDLHFSVFCLAALLVTLKIDPASSPRRRNILELSAGFLIGLACALKLVAMVYFVGLAFAFLIITYRDALRAQLRFIAGAVGGFLIGGGWFFWLLYKTFANPFFPMFNNVFHSPYADAHNFGDETHFPQTLGEWLFYPFYWAYMPTRVAQPAFNDPRVATAFLLGTIVLLSALSAPVLRRFGSPSALPSRPSLVSGRALLALGAFCVISYVVWMVQFSVYRYLVPIEMLSGILIVSSIAYLMPSPVRAVGVAVLCAVFCLMTTSGLEWGHVPMGKKYIDVEVPPLPSNSVVVQTAFTPLGYVIPFMSRDAQFVKFDPYFLTPTQENLLVARAKLLIKDKTRPLYTLRTVDQDPTISDLAYAALGLRTTETDCFPIKSNLDGPLELCAVERDDIVSASQ